MTTAQDIQFKQLEIELERLKGERMEKMHSNKIEQLKIQKEIAGLYCSKKRKKRLGKIINKLEKQKV